MGLTSLSSVSRDETEKELLRAAIGLDFGPFAVLIGVKLRLASVNALTALYGAALLGAEDGSLNISGLPRGVGGYLEPDSACARHHASSNVAGDKLQP